jgi:hypothetical protein
MAQSIHTLLWRGGVVVPEGELWVEQLVVSRALPTRCTFVPAGSQAGWGCVSMVRRVLLGVVDDNDRIVCVCVCV